MADHKFTVEKPDRVISFSVTSDEARAAFDWLRDTRMVAKRAIGDLQPDPPMIINELFGGLSAIAENRRYGGH